MKCLFFELFVKFNRLVRCEDGQDMIEYALVVALVSLGATAGMSSLATGINQAFSNVSTTLQSDVSTILF